MIMIKKTSKSFRKLIFLNYEEMYDTKLFPLLKPIRKISEESSVRKESTMNIVEREKNRKNIFPKKTNRVLTRHSDSITKRGLLFEITSESALRDLKQSFTFLNESDKEICFIHELEMNEKSEIPMQLDNIFEKYQELLLENVELKKNQTISSNPSVIDINEINRIKAEAITKFYKDLSANMFVIFKALNQKHGELINLELCNKDEKAVENIAKDIAEQILKMKDLMVKTKTLIEGTSK